MTCLKIHVLKFGNIFTTDNKVLFCTVCNIEIASDKRFSVTQYVAAGKDQRGVNCTEKNSHLFNQIHYQNRH